MNTKSCGFLGVREFGSAPTAYKTAMMRGCRNPTQTHRVNVRIYPVPLVSPSAPLPDQVHSANCSDAPVRTNGYNLRRVHASHLAASSLCRHPPPLRRACTPVSATYARPNAKPASCLLFGVCARAAARDQRRPLDNAMQRLLHSGLSRTTRVSFTSTLVLCHRDWQGVLWTVASIRCSETTAAHLSCPPPTDRRPPRTRTSAVACAGGWQSRPAARHHRPGVSRTSGT